MTVVDNGPDLTSLATKDRRVARDLSAAERDRLAAAQRIATADAAAERRLREAEGRLQLTGKRDQVKAARRDRRATEREAGRAARRARKLARAQALRARVVTVAGYVRDNAAAVYSSVIYGLAVAGAVYGQIDAAQLHQIPLLFAVAASIAIEGTGLAMALTAQQQRLSRERALAARALVWFCTGIAVTINYLGHVEQNPAKAYVLSALSALGIIVFEIRSGAKHRKQLRDLGMIPEPGEQFGLARWVAYPGETFAAWKLGIRDRLSPGAAALVARVEQAVAARQARRELQAAASRHRQVADEVAGRARKAARAATRKGDAGAALAALVQLAHTGTPAPLLALPSPARAQAEAARAALAAAEARLQTEAEARSEAEAVAAQAEAEATRVRREAEAAIAAVRRQAEAEVADARRRVEAEAARRGEAEARAEAATANFRAEAQRRAEAESHAGSAQQRAEAEARRAAQASGQAETAGRTGDAAQQQLADEQQQRVHAEARAGAAEQLLAEHRERLRQATEQVTALQTQLAAAPARRTRRAGSAAAAAPAEPVLFHGQPIPVIDGASPELACKVLTAYETHPGATRKELAAAAGTTDRTVRTVLSAVPDLLNALNSNDAKETAR